MLLCFMHNSINAQSCFPTECWEQVNVTCGDKKDDKPNNLPHRSPPFVPNVYMDRLNSSLLVENIFSPIVLEFVVSNTDTVVFSCFVSGEVNIVRFPDGLVGEYEVRIHLGDITFSGLVTL